MNMKRGRPKNLWDEVVKRIWGREACASMMPKTRGDGAAEEWSTPVNWEEDPVIMAQRRRQHH